MAEEAVLPPHDLEAEESVLGSCLISDAAIPRAAAILSPGDFYRPSNAIVFRVALEISARDEPVDGVTLSAELERQTLLEAAGGRARVHELVALVPAAGNVEHYARIVRESSINRRAYEVGAQLSSAALNGGVAAHPEMRDLLSEVINEPGAGAARTLPWLTHASVMAEELEPRPAFLIDDLVEPGVVVTIAGVPETHKSWLAQAVAVGVARGSGEILGRRVLDHGSVGYVWQDDSTRNEVERVQLYARVTDTPSDLPIHWLLNEGVSLPGDIPRLRREVERLRLSLIVLDSFYNVAGGVELKDTEAGRIFASLKADLCDPTGCTVVVVDHMPWATETNRQRLRGYGDVFKNAAVRSGIYIDAVGTSLFVEARGNNIRGFKRTAAYWDPERLELRLIDVEHTSVEEVRERVYEFLEADVNWASTRSVEKSVEGRSASIREALDLLRDEAVIVSRTASEIGRRGSGNYWNLAHRDLDIPTLLNDEEEPEP